MTATGFHPAVEDWFSTAFPNGPTDAQRQAWPAIVAGRDTLVAAPTGSGKTLTAFLAAINALVQEGAAQGRLPDRTTVVYVSPLKALSNDIRLNLEAPLAGIRTAALARGLPDITIRAAVRTGDTPARERQAMLRKPPHLLVTTPESLYVLLGSVSGRRLLAGVRSVIVDEIHAVAGSKRGSHLALSLERLTALVVAAGGSPPVRIGLSATQKPIGTVARFLVGAASDRPDCTIIDIGYRKQRDLALSLPPTPLSAVMSNDQWDQVYRQLVELIASHRTTLVFVNTRRMAERAARHLAESLGRDAVAAHHGSLAKEIRLLAEQRLKRGELKVLVATASLELGLDIGEVDLVCQLGSPRSIATFLQRAGRSGHAVGGVPKARLFPQTRDELVECAALLDGIQRGELDALRVPPAPLDVLAQSVAAEVASREEAVHEDALFELVRRATPYADLPRSSFDQIVRLLSDGIASRERHRGSLLHHDAVNRLLRPRRGARLVAVSAGGTIPDTGDFTVLLEPDATVIGTVNEDFAIESMSGDVFQLGNTSYRIHRVESGRLRVSDAAGAPPSIPFWLGEAPGRTDELSIAVSRLREAVARSLRESAGSASERREATIEGLRAAYALPDEAARQIVDYLQQGLNVLGAMPTRQCVVLERFFDESGATQLVLHAPFGSRINRAWGLALRKRFCRRFNVELQAAATEDAIVLSLSTSHSFPLAEVSRYLHSRSAEAVLIQALLDAPMFPARWRWNLTNALITPRMNGGRKVAAPLQRMRSDDLLAAVFPDQVACAENLTGERVVPDHPLVAQTLDDCLHDAMDCTGWLSVLRDIEAGHIRVHTAEPPTPSALTAEILNARPYAFLDDAPLEERRTRAVQSRRTLDPDSVDGLGQLDPDAIAAVRQDAWPIPRDAEELHQALRDIGCLTATEVADQDPRWRDWLATLSDTDRVVRLPRIAPGHAGQSRPVADAWVATERLTEARAVWRAVGPAPLSAGSATAADTEAATQEFVRGRLVISGPITRDELAAVLALPSARVEAALLALQQEGSVLSGRFDADAIDVQWCERHLLARIHRLTLGRLRREIEPVTPRDYARFLFTWQHLSPGSRMRGPDALAAIISQLEGFEAPAICWESEILNARIDDYAMHWLDELCTAGRVVWRRLRPARQDTASAGTSSLRSTPLVLLPRRQAGHWGRITQHARDRGATATQTDPLGTRARRVLDVLADRGASYFDEIAEDSRLLKTELEVVLAELVAAGHVHGDTFAGLRALLMPAARRARQEKRRRGGSLYGMLDTGRWTLACRPDRSDDASRATASATPDANAGITTSASAKAQQEEAVEHVARTLLLRYGVVCWRLVDREAGWLPPWRDLVRVYRRIEARGEIRGGRFIAGLTGEQFALPEAVVQLRAQRRAIDRDDTASGSAPNVASSSATPTDAESVRIGWVAIAATDPANLLGTLLPGPRIARVPGNRVLYQDGLPIAVRAAGRIDWLISPTALHRRIGEALLIRDTDIGSDTIIAGDHGLEPASRSGQPAG